MEEPQSTKILRNGRRRWLLWGVILILLLPVVMCGVLGTIVVQTKRSIWIGTDTFQLQIGPPHASPLAIDALFVLGPGPGGDGNICKSNDPPREAFGGLAFTVWNCAP